MMRKMEKITRILINATRRNLVSFHRDFSGVTFNVRPELIKFCENVFGMPTNQIKSMMLEYPRMQTLNEEQIEEGLAVLKKYSVSPKTVFECPIVLRAHPLTIDNRMSVLKECGFKDIKMTTLIKYLTIVTKNNIAELKRGRHLNDIEDIWDDLVNCFEEWPEIQKNLKNHKPLREDFMTLYDVRQECLRKFLRQSLGMTKSEFEDLINKYQRMKHRSFRNISQTIHLVKNVIQMPKNKILANGFICFADSNNIRMMLQEIQELGGMDIKQALIKNPVLLKSDYKRLLEIEELLKNEGIPPKFQNKCFRLFTLSPDTIKERIAKMKSEFQFKGLVENPRILHVIFKEKLVNDRMEILQDKHKRCSSLHKLTSGTKEFEKFADISIDRTRGLDTINALYKTYKYTPYSIQDLRFSLSKHPYWTRTSLASTISVFEYLQKDFSLDDIYYNSPLLFYPLENIRQVIDYLMGKGNIQNKELNDSLIELRRDDITKSQILGLTAYFLERNIEFTGKGIWQSEK